MKLVTIVGARPQFIKAAAVSRAIRAHNPDSSPPASRLAHGSSLTAHGSQPVPCAPCPVPVPLHEVLVHTGQHYDYIMSQVFFDELGLPAPAYNLEVGSAPHGAQTGLMLARAEEVLLKEGPDWVLVYGDTNSTLAGALAAAKLHIPVAHVEAGLRSFNRGMPEEINRVLTDHVSDLLFCPTETSVKNLGREGISKGVHLVGDVMYDSLLYYLPLAEGRSTILNDLGLTSPYALCTVHRAENTDDPARLRGILSALNQIAADGLPIVLPLHPRTRERLKDDGSFSPHPGLRMVDPVGYGDMLVLAKNAQVVLTDSGGLQKEAYLLGTQCVTLRDETEWVETVEGGCNALAGTQPDRILAAVRTRAPGGQARDSYGDGSAAERIVSTLQTARRHRLPVGGTAH
jgi:UDP-N-acetylglucosamine 2-epimerase